ncbi:MAG: excinuclease ABC subunit C, partial [Candidatus Pacebacteria bacterium]|nr:excinuclease ABC subunit C [Candidatus Paceibacterota bacterium]
KREEVFLPGRPDPVCLSRHNAGLQLLQAVRDEAHRFALSYHHQLRRRRIADSLLGEIEGIGPSRRKALLRAFGSVQRLRKTTAEEISEKVPGLGKKLAETIVQYLRQHTT